MKIKLIKPTKTLEPGIYNLKGKLLDYVLKQGLAIKLIRDESKGISKTGVGDSGNMESDRQVRQQTYKGRQGGESEGGEAGGREQGRKVRTTNKGGSQKKKVSKKS